MCTLFFNFGLFCFVFFLSFFLYCICYKLLIIRLMKAASIDGPSGLLAACPMFNIEMLYCKLVFLWGGANKVLACLLTYFNPCWSRIFFQARCPSCRQTNNIRTLKWCTETSVYIGIITVNLYSAFFVKRTPNALLMASILNRTIHFHRAIC